MYKIISVLVVILLFKTEISAAQDLEPRRWAQLPTGLNFLGIGYGHTEGDIFLDPVLLVEDAQFDMESVALFYMRSLSVLGRSARIDFSLPYHAGRWEGLVDGEFVHFRRRGPGDARVRFSMLLYGGRAESLAQFSKSKKSNTVVGAAVSVTMPTGEYSSERLINLGSNRWVIRPQVGVTHTFGKWTSEFTGSVFLYGNNSEFWRQSRLETDPLYALQAHLIYAFRPGLWLSISSAYGWGGEATVNGDTKNNPAGNWLNALSFGYPLSRTQGVKLTILTGRSQKPTGANIDSLIFGWSVMF